MMMLMTTSGKFGYKLYSNNGEKATEETFTYRTHGPTNKTCRQLAVPEFERRLEANTVKFYTLKVLSFVLRSPTGSHSQRSNTWSG
jgi:hypothetical protein